MKSLCFKSALFGLVLVAAVGAIVTQRQARAALEREGDALRRRNAELASVRAENQRRVAEAAQPPPAPLPATPAPAAIAAPAPAAEQRDPTQGMVATEHLRAAGHATPAAAFQTIVWAALHGDDALLTGSFSMSESARGKLAALLAGLDAGARKKFLTPESIPAMLLAEEMLKKILQLHIAHVEATGDDTAKLQAKITTRVGRVASQTFPMRRVDGKWTLALDDQMVDSTIKGLAEKRP